MAQVKPTTITTSDRCPGCGVSDIAPEDGAPSDSVRVCRCLACGLVFYQYRRTGDEVWHRRSRSISGGAPARPPWPLIRGRPANLADQLVDFGADALREARATRERSRAIRRQRPRPALSTPGS